MFLSVLTLYWAILVKTDAASIKDKNATPGLFETGFYTVLAAGGGGGLRREGESAINPAGSIEK